MKGIAEEAQERRRTRLTARLLAVAAVTKAATLLCGLDQFAAARAWAAEMAAYADVAPDAFLRAVMLTDGPIGLVALIAFCTWLARAAADGRVSFARTALPRRLGVPFLACVALSLGVNVLSLASAVVKAILLCRALDFTPGAGFVPTLPAELPVAYLRVEGIALAALSALQVAVLLLFRRLVVAGRAALRPTPPPPATAAPEAREGFGWPAQPVR